MKTRITKTMSARKSAMMTIGELAEQKAITKRKDGMDRRMMKDLCDFCLKVAYLYRNQIGMRRHGRKFVCEICRFENGRQADAMAIRAMPCWQRSGGWRFVGEKEVTK